MGLEQLLYTYLPEDLKSAYGKLERCRLASVGFPGRYRFHLLNSSDQTIRRPLFVLLDIECIDRYSPKIFNKNFLSVLHDMSITSTEVYLEYAVDNSILSRVKEKRTHLYGINDMRMLRCEVSKLTETMSVFCKSKTAPILEHARALIEARYKKLRELVPIKNKKFNIDVLYVPTKKVKELRDELNEIRT